MYVNMVLDDEKPLDRILAFTIFALHAMVHITMQYTLEQLVFAQDSILNTHHKSNWHLIEKRK